MSKIGNKIKKLSIGLILGLLVLGFFFGTSAYNYDTQEAGWTKFSAPDEAANYIFSKVYHDTGKLVIFEKYNIFSADIIHPRSFRSDQGFLKPVSFPGLILLYGTISKALGVAVLPFLTPLFAALGLIFYYFLVRAIFDRRIAIFSTVLLAFFPVYVYYSARSFFHNVLFVDLLLAGLCLAVYSAKLRRSDASKTLKVLAWPDKSVWLGYTLALAGGLLIGFSLTTRASELLWVGPLLILLGLANLRTLGWMKIVLCLIGIGLGLLPLFYWNQVLYGSFLASGYSEINRSLLAVTQAASASASGSASWLAPWQKLKEAIFYFGFRPEHSLKMGYYYFAAMFPWLFAGTLAGIGAWLARFKKITKAQWLFFCSWVLAGTLLVLYYGSWQFSDNPDLSHHTIGNSYTRYWLPLYLGALVFLSLFISRLSEFSAKWLGRIGRILYSALPIATLFIIAAWSLNFVLIGSEEGLVYTVAKQRAARTETQAVLAATPANSIIVTQYHDKYLFPERKVIVGLLTDDNMNAYYAFLAKHLPLYYFNFTFPEKDLQYLNLRRLPKFGLEINPVQAIGNFTLYKLTLSSAK